MLHWTHAHVNKLPVCLSACLSVSLLYLFMSLWSLFSLYYAALHLSAFSVFMSVSSPTSLSPFMVLCSLSWAEQLVNVPSTPGVILAQPSTCLCLQVCVALALPLSGVAGLTAAQPECFWHWQHFGHPSSLLSARPLSHSSQLSVQGSSKQPFNYHGETPKCLRSINSNDTVLDCPDWLYCVFFFFFCCVWPIIKHCYSIKIAIYLFLAFNGYSLGWRNRKS